MTGPRVTIRALRAADGGTAVALINEAAAWYAEFLPPEELHGPEMTLEAWRAEGQRMTWYGAFEGADLVGVVGLEPADDAVLFRHAYVRPDRQRRGVAALLLEHVEAAASGAGRFIVGTYAANFKARAALEKAGYAASPDPVAVLRRYYRIPEDRLRSSVTYEKLPGP